VGRRIGVGGRVGSQSLPRKGSSGEEREKAKSQLWDLMARVGRAVARMHEIGVCHGDLTTSNLMLRPPVAVEEDGDEFSPGNVRASLAAGRGTVSAQREHALNAEVAPADSTRLEAEVELEGDDELSTLDGDIVLIDFGLATQSLQDEDRAVDLYVLERAFAATHPVAEPLFREVLRVYGESYKGAKVVLRRLEDVRMRGRKRSMLG